MWTLPMVTFFLTSSALSHLYSSRKSAFESMFEKSSERDAMQVLANGGVGGAMVLLAISAPAQFVYPAFVGAVAAANADTWGTELGLLSSRPPRLVTTLKQVSHGTSGAVSVVGLFGAAVGSAIVGCSAIPWSSVVSRNPIIYALLGGMSGMAVDSLVGASLQARYRCAVCASLTEKREHCEKPALLEGGYGWMTNDSVNLSCTIAGAAVGGVSGFLC